MALRIMRAFIQTFFSHANIYKTACEFLLPHDILVAPDRATIVKVPLGKSLFLENTTMGRWNKISLPL